MKDHHTDWQLVPKRRFIVIGIEEVPKQTNDLKNEAAS